MNSKITCDFLVSKLSLDYLAEKYSLSKAEVVKSIFQFLKTHKKSSLYEKVERKLKVVLTTAFLSYPGRRSDFAETHGMSEGKFVSLVKEVIEDTSLVHSDVLADKIFRKLTLYKMYTVSSIPKRIIIHIGQCYANSNITQAGLAASYGINESSVSNILRRGISEGIFDEELANKVYVKVKNCKYMTLATLRAYTKAFDKREQLI